MPDPQAGVLGVTDPNLFASNPPFGVGPNLPGATTIPMPSGTIAATIWDWSGVTYNVKASNAKGDGVTDDTGAIHKARDTAGVNGDVTIPAGTYATATGYNANVAGQHWLLCPGATLRATATGILLMNLSASGVVLDGYGTLDGGGLANVYCFGMFNTNQTIAGLTIKNGGWYEGQANNCSGGRLLRNRITHGGTQPAFLLSVVSGTPVDDFIAELNTVTLTSDQAGFAFHGIAGDTAITRSAAVNNRLTLPANATHLGIEFWGLTTGCIAAFNRITGGSIAISFDRSTSGALIGNIVSAAVNYGLELASSPSCLVQGNTIDAAGLTQLPIAIDGASSNYPSIIGNTVINPPAAVANAHAIQGNTASGTVKGAVISGNTLNWPGNSTSEAMDLSGFVDFVVTSNTCIGGGTSVRGVSLAQGSTVGRVADNVFDGYTESAVHTFGTAAIDAVVVGPNILTGGTPAELLVSNSGSVGTGVRILRGNLLPANVTTPAVSTPLTNTFFQDLFVSFIANAAGTTFTVNGKALAATPANAQGGFVWPAGTVMSYVNAPASWVFVAMST